MPPCVTAHRLAASSFIDFRCAGMGLEKAKSLLELKDGNTFLDFIAKQVRTSGRRRKAA